MMTGFDYGRISYKRRYSINLSLDDYQIFVLNKSIRMGIVYKYKTASCDNAIAEVQIVYKDENDTLQCLCLNLHEWTFKIEYLGSMMCNL